MSNITEQQAKDALLFLLMTARLIAENPAAFQALDLEFRLGMTFDEFVSRFHWSEDILLE